MDQKQKELVNKAKKVALEVLLYNNHGAYRNLPRTAGWGYPEPYTRDLMICSLGILTTQNKRLLKSLRRVLETLAGNQSDLGHIPSLVHDREDRGSSDTTPLFLMAVGIYRKFLKEDDFLEQAVQKALNWMKFQSPANRCRPARGHRSASIPSWTRRGRAAKRCCQIPKRRQEFPRGFFEHQVIALNHNHLRIAWNFDCAGDGLILTAVKQRHKDFNILLQRSHMVSQPS